MSSITDERKDVLIRDAAIKLFYKNGIEDTSINSIAQEAGVAKGTIYLYFHNREHLVNEIAKYCYKGHLDFSMRSVREEQSASGKLKKRVKNMLIWSSKNPLESAVIRYYYKPVNIFGTKDVFFDESYNLNKEIIEEGISNGEFKKLPIDFITSIFFSSVEGISNYARNNPEVLNNEALLDEMLKAIIAGFKNS